MKPYPFISDPFLRQQLEFFLKAPPVKQAEVLGCLALYAQNYKVAVDGLSHLNRGLEVDRDRWKTWFEAAEQDIRQQNMIIATLKRQLKGEVA